ncbi:hypothetical protein HPB50_001111 [Hyalomma asiaticum]|uniref:Uncharacterized protein n=1 Tax=Hyalomma asiaticum TaxID=266040 RepID=A0ACB7RXI7_HYAAI|nr:hypothetical protein HPB50_001111 [Hyalomma asiaticum]
MSWTFNHRPLQRHAVGSACCVGTKGQWDAAGVEPKGTDFVVLLKCRTQLYLAAVFPENGAGRALIAHLGATASRLVTIVLVREQNLTLVYTSNPHIADKLIGEFAVPSSVGPVPMFGYLWADTQDSCYGVVTVPNSDNEATLRESLYWSEGEILHVRYVSYDALLIPVQPYKKTVPACSRCGSVGHRPDTCPGPKPDLCGICRKAVPLTDGSRAPHECTPRCALCAGPHVTGGRRCRERYRVPPPKPPTPPPEGQTGPGKRKRRRRRKPRKLEHRAPPQGAQPSATNAIVPPYPGAGASGLPYEGQLRTNLRSRGLLRGRLCPHRPNRIRRYLDPSLLPRGTHRGPTASEKDPR